MPIYLFDANETIFMVHHEISRRGCVFTKKTAVPAVFFDVFICIALSALSESE